MAASHGCVAKLAEKKAQDHWVDRQGVYVLAFVALLVSVALAVVNSTQYAEIGRNTAEIERIKVQLAETIGLVAESSTQLKVEGARHEKDIVRIFGILGKAREVHP